MSTDSLECEFIFFFRESLYKTSKKKHLNDSKQYFSKIAKNINESAKSNLSKKIQMKIKPYFKNNLSLFTKFNAHSYQGGGSLGRLNLPISSVSAAKVRPPRLRVALQPARRNLYLH